MKEISNALKYSLISQLTCWIIFSLSNVDACLIIGIFLLIILLYIYIKYNNKIIKKNNLNSNIYNVFLFIFWIIMSILFPLGLYPLVDKYIHICNADGWDCFLNGVQFFVYAFFMICLAILIVIGKFILKIYHYYKKENN